MRFACPNSAHERRLVLEGAYLYRLFVQLAPHLGIFVLGKDGFVLGLIERLDLDLPGASAIKIRVGKVTATAIVAPGVIFGNPELLADLKRLRRDAQDRGRRVVLVPKRSLKNHARGRLPEGALVERRRRRTDRTRSRPECGLHAQRNARERVPIGGSDVTPAITTCGADVDA